MKKLKPFVLFLGLGLLSTFANAGTVENGACGFPDVRLIGATADERESTCDAVTKISALFATVGIATHPKMILTFKDNVTLPVSSPKEKPTSVYGYFDSDTNEIFMTHFAAKRQKQNRKPWGFEWNDELAASFLLHEISHLMTIQYMGDREKSISHTWHEAVAYSIQFELMSPTLRTAITEKVGLAETDVFEHPAHVYAMVYRADPEVFAVKAYNSIRKMGGMPFLKNLFDGKVQGAQDHGW